MENKFTKGVLERQEREHNKQVLEQHPLSQNSEETSVSPFHYHLSDLIDRKGEGERKAKNKTFYLDDTVIQAVKKAASSHHVTESKLVNDILKKILFSQK